MVAILDTGVADHPWFTDRRGRPGGHPAALRRRRAVGRAGDEGDRRGADPNLIDPLRGPDRPVLRPRHLHRRADPPGLPGRPHPVDQGDGHRRHRRRGRRCSTGSVTCTSARSRRGGPGRTGSPSWSTSSACRSATTTSPTRPAMRTTPAEERAGCPGRGRGPGGRRGRQQRQQPAAAARRLPSVHRRHAPGSPRDAVPLVSVGALNPDGSVALFSNAGAWVACHSPGAALVSTLPEVRRRAQRSGVDLGSRRPASGRSAAGGRPSTRTASPASAPGAVRRSPPRSRPQRWRRRCSTAESWARRGQCGQAGAPAR